MKNYNNKGKWGEEVASRFLEKKDIKIIQRNYKTKFGEIDIICKQDNIIVFVEVKMRSKSTYLQACESINVPKIKKIKKVASLYLQEIGQQDSICRFDVIIILGSQSQYDIHHIEDAFR